MSAWLKKNEKMIQYIWFTAIIIVFGITRLWQLSTLPLGIHIDEAGMGYDAYCLANYGVDRYMKSWPVYLKNFSTGQSSLYAFVCAAVLQFAEFDMFALRLPAVIFSFLALVFGMKLMKVIYPDNSYPALFVGSLITISPYFIMNGRLGLDCNLMLGTSMVFLCFFVNAIKTEKTWCYVLSGITGGIVLYSYALSYIILPLFLLFSLIYLLIVKRFSFKKWFIMAIPLGILAMPLILVQIVNYFDLPEMQLGIFTITKMTGYRISEIGILNKEYMINAFRSIFVGDHLPFNSIPGIWNMYKISVVFFVFGLVSIIVKSWRGIKNKQCYVLTFPVLWFFAVLLLAMFMKTNTYRVNGVFPAVILVATEGICVVGRLGQRYIKKFVPIMFVVFGCVYAVCFLRFGKFYYGGEFTAVTYNNIHNFGMMIEEGIEFIESDSELSQKMTCVWERSIYYAVSKQLPPWEFDVVGDSYGVWNNYWFGSLPEITFDYNYIIPKGQYLEYCEDIRAAGLDEKDCGDYVVFYKKLKTN